jgi:NAD(P)-dependent dehydrogenase (short-subunit alcohol dehydrogenase family)
MPTEKQVAIVTGAASGLGRAMTLGLLTAGFDVAGVDRNADGLAGVAEAARERQARGVLEAVGADLADPDVFDGIVAGVLARFGRIDVLVNNAGIGQSGVRDDQRRNPIRFWEVTPEQWGRFLAVNATAPIMLARAVLPHMLARKSGRIITVTTSLGTMIREGYLLYGASKAAAEAAMAVLSNDLAGTDFIGTGVTANVLVPGGVTNTPLVGDDAGDRSRMLQPEVMVPPLLYLVSDEAAGVNGRRFIGADWDASLPPAQAAEKAGAPIAWTSIARMPIEPER